MEHFKTALYEAVLVAFGKVLAKYNVFAQGCILSDVGKEIIEYLAEQGLGFEEHGNLEDLSALIDLFVRNGFADGLEVEPAEKGQNYLPNTALGSAADLAERLRTTLSHSKICADDGSSFTITASIGVATNSDGSSDIVDMMSQADTALFKAKDSGRDRVVISTFA